MGWWYHPGCLLHWWLFTFFQKRLAALAHPLLLLPAIIYVITWMSLIITKLFCFNFKMVWNREWYWIHQIPKKMVRWRLYYEDIFLIMTTFSEAREFFNMYFLLEYDKIVVHVGTLIPPLFYILDILDTFEFSRQISKVSKIKTLKFFFRPLCF